MQFIIHKPGLLTTIQDQGRISYFAQAVPVSGPMDALAARIANMAVGNEAHAAVIEFTYGGAVLSAQTDALIAFSGDGCEVRANGEPVPFNKPVFVPAGITLTLFTTEYGCRSYLAIAGGWDVPELLQSRSTYLPAALGGWKGRALQANDLLTNEDRLTDITLKIEAALKGDTLRFPVWSIARRLLLPADTTTIRVMRGREFNWFTGSSVNAFFTGSYALSHKSNRIGYYLEGVLLERSTRRELLSTAVTPGTIQVTGNGSPVLLMTDCQTTGGYPRVAQVAAADLPLCGQLRPGDQISFREITAGEAERLYFEQEKQLEEIVEAIRLKYCS